MDGLRFACVPGCTRCCDMEGFVYLTEADLKRMARLLGMSPAEFESAYVYRSRRRLRLRKPKGAQCPFIRQDGCAVHPAKPTQCRLFPFWPEFVENRRGWLRAARRCPGIGSGPLYQIGTAMEVASEMKQAYPSMY